LHELEAAGQPPRRTFQEPEPLGHSGSDDQAEAVIFEVVEPVGKPIGDEAGRVALLPGYGVDRVRVLDMSSHWLLEIAEAA
jgi:hypothetical protein